LAADAVSHLVEEAVRSNAGIVGPKFVDADRPQVLLQVGLSADKTGVPYSPVEPGEIDHEQHDAVRDMLGLPSAAMLVRADLWSELGGFDAEFTAGIEELDLCWRARLAGARVMVVPDAVVARPRAALEARFGADPDAARALEPRNRLQMLLRNYSGWSLLRVLPQALAVAMVQAAALAAMGRARRSLSIVSAWFWNLRHLRTTLRQRRAVQAMRAVPDADVRALQIRGSAYLRAFLSGQLHLGTRMDALSGASRDAAETFADALRRPTPIFAAVFLLVVLMGSRELIGSGVPSVGSFLPWPGMSDLWREFTSAWRHAWIGSPAPAAPAFALMAGLSALLFGNADAARTLVIVAAIPVAAIGAYRMMLPLARSAWAPIGAAVAYAVLPLPRNVISSGRLGPLVLYAAGPFLLERVLRASGIAPFGDPDDDRPARDRRRALLSLGILTAIVVSFFPPAALIVPYMALTLVVGSALAGGRTEAVRGLAASALAVGIAVLLLFPWSLSLLLPTPDLGALGFVYQERPSVTDVVTFDTGRALVGFGWLMLAVAAHPLLIGSGFRLRWATRAWFLALAGWLAAWLPGRFDLGAGTPPVEAALVVAALGISMAVGLGSGILREELRRTGLGWRQLASVAASAGLVIATLPFLGEAFGGRWDLRPADWARSLRWMDAEQADGGFRVLWLGDPSELPLHSFTLSDGTGYGVTRNGTGDARDLFPPPADSATSHLSAALEAALDGRTDRLGHMVGPLAVRYVAAPVRAQPSASVPSVRELDTRLAAALARQIDLVQLQVDPAMILYENRAWMPDRAIVDGDAAEAALDGAPLDTLSVGLDGAVAVGGGARPGDGLDGEGVVVVAERYDDGWSARTDEGAAPHSRAFGLVNAFPVQSVEGLDVSHGGQLLRYGAITVQFLLWAVVVVAWRRRASAERAEQYAHRQAARDVRPSFTPSGAAS
ncbi:MAG TPA: hypothetical protein VM618_11255, partial [Acidimicrobiia bacterium]|nr:hypothetical protein [Acidimicrobiia bacterium]